MLTFDFFNMFQLCQNLPDQTAANFPQISESIHLKSLHEIGETG